MPASGALDVTRTVFLTGMFDMHNFGDLMFPLVARHRLAPLGIDVLPVAPTGIAPRFADAMAPVSVEAMLSEDHAVDGVVIGGGYIIHTHRIDFMREYRTGAIGAWAGPSLWLGATLAAAVRDVPVMWNAPGAPHPLPTRLRPLIGAALRAADYVALRDHGSDHIVAGDHGIPVSIVPDPIADLAGLWPRATLDEPFRAVIARKGASSSDRFFALHVRGRSAAGMSSEAFAGLVDAFAADHHLTPILIAVGSSHGDDEFARVIAARLRSPAVVLDDPDRLVEIAAAVGCSELYLGSSLHGYVAAAAYGVPGVLVARPAYKKFGGFVEHTGRQQDLAKDWVSAFASAPARLAEPRPPPLSADVLSALDRHWLAIAGAVRAGPERKQRERLAFARQAIAEGVRQDGAGWAIAPFVDPRTRAAAADDSELRDGPVF
ncbi:MAG: polysaccharide pyruvyl transferase family protein [Bauldia sp.]|nr:polysaccharide pyruvyl transferase family protein [Bauldia sp.]